MKRPHTLSIGGASQVEFLATFFWSWPAGYDPMETLNVKPFEDIDAAKEAVNAHDGPPEEFLLPICDSLQDAMGISMAIIADAVLARGWDVDGFEQRDGYRVYRYRSQD